MTPQKRHLDAICAAVERRLAAAPEVTARRLLRPQFRWVAQELDDELAERLGVVALVESCRDEHLSTLDADEGLAALQIDWTEVVVRVAKQQSARGIRCRRCGARLPARRERPCGRCGYPSA